MAYNIKNPGIRNHIFGTSKNKAISFALLVKFGQQLFDTTYYFYMLVVFKIV